MESVFVKIPVLGDKIIRELDNSSLVKCKEVKRSWYNFIKAEKILWFRKIQNCIGDENKFSKARKKLLTKVSSDLVMQVAIGCQQACATFQIFNIQISPIHMAAAAGNLDLYQLIMLKLAGMNQTDIFGKVPPIFPAALNYDMQGCIRRGDRCDRGRSQILRTTIDCVLFSLFRKAMSLLPNFQ